VRLFSPAGFLAFARFAVAMVIPHSGNVAF
jgi:hypothetical protein